MVCMAMRVLAPASSVHGDHRPEAARLEENPTRARRLRFVRARRLSRGGASDTSRDVAVAVLSSSSTSRALALALLLAVPATTIAAPAAGTFRLKTGSRGASVLIDGSPVGVTPLPGPWTLPPGAHTVELRPKSGPSVKAAFTIAIGQEAQVELLAAESATDAASDAPIAGPQRVIYSGPGFSLATAGYITAGVGVASGALAVLFGLQANSKADEARGLDKADRTLTRADQQRLADDADQAALLCNVTMGVGVVAGLSGAAMILLASDGPLGISWSPAPGGAVVGGRF